MNLVRHARRARRESRLEDAHLDLVEAIALCRQAGAQHELVQALKGLAQIERDMGRGDAALPLYEEAVALSRDHSDAIKLAHTIRHLGDLHQDASRVELAEPCYEEALTIYRRSQETSSLDLANAIRSLAVLKGDAGELEAARRLWREARDLYAAVDLQDGVAECEARLARLGE